MAEKENSEPKAKLDDDDILAELGLTNDKAEIDAEGLVEKEEFDDKAVLDKDGILDEEIPQELDIAQSKVKPSSLELPVKKKESPEINKNKLFANQYIIQLKKLLVSKVFLIAAGFFLLLVTSGLIVGLFYRSDKKNESKESISDISVIDEKKDKETEDEEVSIEYDLEPFIIPVKQHDKVTAFIKLDIQIQLNKNVLMVIKHETRYIRETIYTVLSTKKSSEIISDNKRDEIILELCKRLNMIIKKNAVQQIIIKNILIV